MNNKVMVLMVSIGVNLGVFSTTAWAEGAPISVSIGDIKLTSTANANNAYKLRTELVTASNKTINVAYQWFAYKNGSSFVVEPLTHLQELSLSNYPVGIDAFVPEKYFVQGCAKVLLNAYDKTGEPLGRAETLCLPIAPKEMLGQWVWQKPIGWDKDFVFPLDQVSLQASLTQANGSLWDMKSAAPQNATLLEVNIRKYTPSSVNQAYLGPDFELMTPQKLIDGSAVWRLASGCNDYKVRIVTRDGKTANPAVLTKINPSAWLFFTGGSSCEKTGTSVVKAPASSIVTPPVQMTTGAFNAMSYQQATRQILESKWLMQCKNEQCKNDIRVLINARIVDVLKTADAGTDLRIKANLDAVEARMDTQYNPLMQAKINAPILAAPNNLSLPYRPVNVVTPIKLTH
ncbi:MAG: hypothetical protein HOP20_06580 [Sulfuriferula sp.]|nr:hypothetical protein [Sulfuriferula sp.]